MKCCSKCKIIKEFIFFEKRTSGKDGYRNTCKECDKMRISRSKEYRSMASKKDYKKHKQKRIEKDLKRYREKKEEILLRQKQYINGKGREVYLKNIRRRKEEDINYREMMKWRDRIAKAIKYEYKNGLAIEVLGCKISFYKNYLENKFYDKMTWSNYGTYWQIDHIIPCSRFDLIDHEEVRACFNYKNTRPLTRKDNMKKFNKLFSDI